MNSLLKLSDLSKLIQIVVDTPFVAPAKFHDFSYLLLYMALSNNVLLHLFSIMLMNQFEFVDYLYDLCEIIGSDFVEPVQVLLINLGVIEVRSMVVGSSFLPNEFDDQRPVIFVVETVQFGRS